MRDPSVEIILSHGKISDMNPSSWAQVALGFARGLMSNGVEVEYPIDFGAKPKGRHDCAIMFGDPRSCKFTHEWADKYVMLAANSTRVHQDVIRAIVSHNARILTPSHWSAEAIWRTVAEMFPAAFVGGEVGHLLPWVVPHGVYASALNATPGPVLQADIEGSGSGSAPDASETLPVGPWDGKRPIHLFHHTASLSGRKCTAQVIEAWRRVLREGAVPKGSTLTISTPDEASARYHATSHAIQPNGLEGILVYAAFAHHDSFLARLRMFDMVVQPSAAEGFGLVPLEALSVGTPVLVTNGTGMDEYLARKDIRMGAALLLSEDPPLVSATDAPGGEWLGVTAAHVYDALVGVTSTESRVGPLLAHAQLRAWEGAKDVQDAFSWERAVRPFIAKHQERYDRALICG